MLAARIGAVVVAAVLLGAIDAQAQGRGRGNGDAAKTKGNGPAFCRSGEGHPVHGWEWCREKGWDRAGRVSRVDRNGRVIDRDGRIILPDGRIIIPDGRDRDRDRDGDIAIPRRTPRDRDDDRDRDDGGWFPWPF